MTERIYYKWEPIKDLASDWRELGSSRLKNLAEVWKEQKERLNDTLLDEFMTKLKREWAIETGMIENLYKLDRGLTLTLVEHGVEILDSLHEADIKEAGRTKALILDQQEVVEGLFAFVKGERPLSTSYIKEIHQTLTRNQETVESIDTLGMRQKIGLERGVWKKLPNNPTRAGDGLVHEYCPPEHVASEIDQLLRWHNEHENIGVRPEIEAAWFHHCFTQIHPFQDGNGRVARALATVILIKAGWFPLIVSYSERSEYLNALEAADHGDLKALVDFFSAAEQKSFLSAMKISASLLDKTRSIDTALAAIGQKLQTLSEQKTKEQRRVWEIADNFKITIARRVEELSAQLSSLFRNSPINLQTSHDASSDHNYGYDWFRGQLLKGAQKYDYYANLREDHFWRRMKIKSGQGGQEEKTVFSIIISIHPIGREFTGILAATTFSEYRDFLDDGTTVSEPCFSNEQPFIFTYKDTDRQTQEKFEIWLNETLAIALTEWQAQL